MKSASGRGALDHCHLWLQLSSSAGSCVRCPEKRAIVAFPPGRHEAGFRSVAAGYFTLSRDVCRDSQVSRPGCQGRWLRADAASGLELREPIGGRYQPGGETAEMAIAQREAALLGSVSPPVQFAFGVWR